MLTRTRIIVALVLLTLAVASSCSRDGAEPEPSVTGATNTTEFSFNVDECIGAAGALSVGLSAQQAAVNESQIDDDFWVALSFAVSTCRLYIKWRQGASTYEWDERIEPFSSFYSSTCVPWPPTPSGLIFTADTAVYIQESWNRVIQALLLPVLYNVDCGTFQNPMTGQIVQTVSFDDTSDPVFGSVRRTLRITTSP